MYSPEQYRALREGAGLIDRSTRGRLKLTGQDRRTYLQGILTNDIAALEPGTGCYAAYLTPQGRMISDLRVFELGDAVLVDLDGGLAPSVRDRWMTFIFSEDVEVADITASTAQAGVYGPGAAAALARTFDAGRSAGEPAPGRELLDALAVHESRRWDFQGQPAIVLRSDDAGVPGFDVVLPAEKRGELERLLLEHGAVRVEPDTAAIVRVEAGRPLFGVDMTEDTIPLEAGIEDRAISLTKGCYVGQEIIIRVLHRGHGRVAKRLVGLALPPGSPVPSAGDKVTSGEREIGAVTSAVESPALGRPIALGYVHRDFTEAATPVAVKQGEKETAATVTPLPFIP